MTCAAAGSTLSLIEPDDRLPDRMESGGVLLRRWVVDDVPELNRAVEESLDHLRPWMPWVALEPLSIEARRDLVQLWDREETEGAGTVFGIFVDNQIAGGTGLHRRIGPRGFEIGYWVHPRSTGRGVATTAARLLTDAAFSVPSTTHVEIHHDKANIASGAVPRRLGYRFVGERSDEVAAPGEAGIDCCWRVERDDWA